MDESTSALDVELETRCMQSCVERGITMISVGHRPTLLQFHQQLLLLDGRGGFKMETLSAASMPSMQAGHGESKAGLMPTLADRDADAAISGGHSKDDVAVIVQDTEHTALIEKDKGFGVRKRRQGNSKSSDRSAGGLAVSTADLFGEETYEEEQDNPWEAAMFKDTTAIDSTVNLDMVFLRRFWRLFRAGGIVSLCSVCVL